jgi:hypothetical protein
MPIEPTTSLNPINIPPQAAAWNPQFSIPTAPIALQSPVLLLQHVEAQSALLRHCPVMNWLPFPLPTFCAPGLLESTAGFAVAGAAAAGAAPPPNPQFWIPTAPMALQSPVLLLQHVDAQSALLRHWPVMNWLPSPLPTFWAPGLLVSMARLAVEAAAVVAAGEAGAATAGAAAAAGAAPAAAWNPQFWMPTAPMALHRPVFLLQHVEAQSALLKHCPVMNWLPSPLPTFWAPGLLESMAGFAVEVVLLLLPAAGACAAGALELSVAAAPDAWKPQASMPTAPIALQRPVFLLQQVEAQSALLKHWPVMNWLPLPLPTLRGGC